MVVAPTGIEEFQNNSNQIEVYPNPSSGSFQIKSDEVITEVEILSVIGEKVYSEKFIEDKTQIDLRNVVISSGYYLMFIHTPNKIYFQKLLLNPY